MATISTLAVNLIARTSVFERNIRKSNKQAKTFRKTLNSVGNSVLKMGNRLSSGVFNIFAAGLKKVTRLAKLATVALLGIGIASVKIASDVVETDNLFKISMGSMATQASKFARVYSESLGLFENDTRKALGTFQLMLTAMGIGEEKAFDMSKGLVTLANDIASFRNQRPQDMFLKLQAGITGESEPLKRLGILVNETTIKQLAMTKGMFKTNDALKKQTRVLTDAEKVLLRYEAIVNATDKDTGDMARTLDDTANVFRVIMAQIKTTANTIGKALLPRVTEVAIAFRDWLTGNQALFEKWANKTVSAIEVVIARLRVYFAMAKAGRFDLIFKDIGKIFGGISKGLVELFDRVKPIAVDLGKQIASGFLESIADTKLGKFLVKAEDVAGNIAAPFTIGRDFGRRGFANTEGQRLESRIGSIRDRATGKFQVDDRRDAELLSEIKKIRLATEENIRDF